MNRAVKNTAVLALIKWVLHGYQSEMEDGVRNFPSEKSRNECRKRITLAIHKLPDVGMRKSLQEWLRRLDLHGRADGFYAILDSLPKDELPGELERLAQMSAWRREAALRNYNSTPWMQAFRRISGGGKSKKNRAARATLAAALVAGALWLATYPYRAVEGFLRFGMERGHVEPETINLWVPQVMDFLVFMVVMYGIYFVFFKREQVTAPAADKSAAGTPDPDSEKKGKPEDETKVVVKEETKTTTSSTSSETKWWQPVLVFALAVALIFIVAAIWRDMDRSEARTVVVREASRANCQFGTDHLRDGVGCDVNITLPEDEFPECIENCTEADKVRFLERRCPECRTVTAAEIGPDGWPTAVEALSLGDERDGTDFEKKMCGKANEGWVSHARWRATGSVYYLKTSRGC